MFCIFVCSFGMMVHQIDTYKRRIEILVWPPLNHHSHDKSISKDAHEIHNRLSYDHYKLNLYLLDSADDKHAQTDIQHNENKDEQNHNFNTL